MTLRDKLATSRPTGIALAVAAAGFGLSGVPLERYLGRASPAILYGLALLTFGGLVRGQVGVITHWFAETAAGRRRPAWYPLIWIPFFGAVPYWWIRMRAGHKPSA